jgi:hypothetical protein
LSLKNKWNDSCGYFQSIHLDAGLLASFSQGMKHEPKLSDHQTDEQHVTDAALALARLFARVVMAETEELESHQFGEHLDDQAE